jgi:hypothetical protein
MMPDVDKLLIGIGEIFSSLTVLCLIAALSALHGDRAGEVLAVTAVALICVGYELQLISCQSRRAIFLVVWISWVMGSIFAPSVDVPPPPPLPPAAIPPSLASDAVKQAGANQVARAAAAAGQTTRTSPQGDLSAPPTAQKSLLG